METKEDFRNYELEYEMAQLREHSPREYLFRFCKHNGPKHYVAIRRPISVLTAFVVAGNDVPLLLSRVVEVHCSICGQRLTDSVV